MLPLRSSDYLNIDNQNRANKIKQRKSMKDVASASFTEGKEGIKNSGKIKRWNTAEA